MTDITIIDAADGSVRAELDSKDNTTVRDLLEMIGKGILVDARGTMKASKSVVLEKGTYKWTGTPKASSGRPSPAKKSKDIRDLLDSQEFEFRNKLVQVPKPTLFGRDEAKEKVINYINECASKDNSVFVGGKFEMFGTSGVKGIGKTELQHQICTSWVKEVSDVEAKAIYASYNGGGCAAAYCTDLENIKENLSMNGRTGCFEDSLGHLLLVSCGVEIDIATQVPFEVAVEFIRSKELGEDSDGVLVVCVDEIIELTTPVPGYFDNEGSQMKLAEVIMSRCMKVQDKSDGKLIFIFTALLDSIYRKLWSGSGRPVRRLPLSLIPLEDVFHSILTDDLKKLVQFKPAVHQLVLACAGHPRAIMDGLLVFTKSWKYQDEIGIKKIISVRDEIVRICKFEPDYINDEILAEWFDMPPLRPERREELLSKGILHEVVEGVEYLFPLLLQLWAERNSAHSVFAFHLDQLFDSDALLGQDSEKNMEPVMYHYEALRRKAMAGQQFNLKSFYETDNFGKEMNKILHVTAPVPVGATYLVEYVEDFEDMDPVLMRLEHGYLVVSLKHSEVGVEYLAPYRTAEDQKLVVACVQCKFVKQSVDWAKVKTEMQKAVQGLEKKQIQHFPVIYTTADQGKVMPSTYRDGVYLIEKNIFAFTKRLGILRLHTQKLGNALTEEYPFLKGSAMLPF